MFGGVAVLFLFSFPFKFLFPIAQAALAMGIVLVAADIFILYNGRFNLTGSRAMGKVLSLGSDNIVRLIIENRSPIGLSITIIDELPFQLQERRFRIVVQLAAREKRQLEYIVKPLQRGAYFFGKLNLFARSFLGLVERREAVAADKEVAVYPSVIQMRRFELRTFTRIM